MAKTGNSSSPAGEELGICELFFTTVDDPGDQHTDDVEHQEDFHRPRR